MIFNFLRYLRPTWYFNLRPKTDYGYFPTAEQLEQQGISIPTDTGFRSEEAQKRERAWRAFQQGFIAKKEVPGIDVWKPVKMPVADEYRFIRKNFHKAWVLYVLLFRLFSFKNPFREVAAYLKTSGVKRVDYAQNPISYPEYERFESPLLQSQPFVSVVIPTLNRYEYLKDVFKDLEKQTYKNFEVIVVDQTEPFQEAFYKGWNLDLTFWYQEEKALWKARNEAIKAAKGEYILLYDDDSLVEPDWIAEHIKTLDYFDADLSSGVSLSVVGGEIPAHYRFFRWSDQLDTGNVLLKKDIFRNIGLFDRQFEKQRMGDGEYGLRAYLAGYKNISNPYAKRVHLKVGSGGLRQMGSWDGWRPKKWTDPRPVPSVLYLSRKYYGDAFAKLWTVHSILPSVLPYRFKKNKFLKLVAVIFLPLIFPLVVLQVRKSWKMATAKLEQGAMVELL